MISLRIMLRANADRLVLCGLGAVLGVVAGWALVYVVFCFCPDSTEPY